MVSNNTRFTLRISKTLDDKVSRLAQEEQISKNAVIVKACRHLIDMYVFEDNKRQSSERG